MKTSTIVLLGGGALVAWWLYQRKSRGQASVADLAASWARGVVPGRTRGPLASLSNPPAPRDYIPGVSPPPPVVRGGGPGMPRTGDSGKMWTPGVINSTSTGARVPGAQGGGPVAGPGAVNKVPTKVGGPQPLQQAYTRQSSTLGGPGYARFTR